MKISLLEVENYKRVKKIVIAPGDRSMVLIGGKNRQGKSSLIGAMSSALGGTKESPEKPIRKGQKAADIKIELDGGELVVHRRFLESGNSRLEVTSKDAKLKSPQAVLDRLVGTRFLDPLRFSRLSSKEQREVLLKCVDLGLDLDAWAAERKEVYEQRTAANRTVKQISAQLEANPDPGPIPEAQSADDLLAKLQELTERDSAKVKAQHELADMRRDLTGRREEICDEKDRHKQAVADMHHLAARHQRELEELRARHEREKQEQEAKIAAAAATVTKLEAALEKFIVAGKAKAADAEDLTKIDLSDEIAAAQAAIKEAAAINEQRTNLLAQQERHDHCVTAFEKARADAAKLDDEIKDLDSEKASALSSAKMPVENLDIDDDHLLYNGVPLSQASGAEQLQVSLAIAAALSPELRDIWVEDGALLDTDSLKLVHDFAKAHDLRIWLERVGESDDDVVIIEEGVVRA